MRKLIVFFNGIDPYVIEVGEHLDTLRLEYPDKTKVDLQIMSYRYPGEDVIEVCFYVTDRHLNQREIVQAKENLL
ncbi:MULTISPECIES: hypothetical protein [Enterobacter]|uniref:hypothetical protein n=1 Tax=Enterobacter TaxID=547 RepID=UPI002DB79657|nr:hypothetical protein [Enterobacter roggenkampii]MEB5888769.1 hypothetical protein [Enterobacter roggenkampii]